MWPLQNCTPTFNTHGMCCHGQNQKGKNCHILGPDCQGLPFFPQQCTGVLCIVQCECCGTFSNSAGPILRSVHDMSVLSQASG